MRILFTLLTILLVSYEYSSADDKLKDLSIWFQGDFSTSEQHQKDSTMIDIHLKVAQFELQDQPGVWAYLEISFSNDIKNPYRQEVYHFHTSSMGLIQMDKYALTDASAFVGACGSDSLLAKIKLESLALKSNCSVVINNTGGIYVGRTNGKSCSSNLRGASYSIIDLEITKVDFFLWERGYNSKGKHVWGSEINGYIFKKLK